MGKPGNRKNISREDVLDAIRQMAKGQQGKGGECLLLQKFTQVSGLSRADVCRYFPNWAEALRAAGVGLEPYNRPVTDEELLADWGNVARKLGRLPPASNYRFHGRYSPSTFEKRFHKWSNIGRAFRVFAHGKKEWADVVASLPAVAATNLRMGPWSKANRAVTKEELESGAVAIPMEGRMTVGDPLDFPGLANEPTTESGVVFVFGLLAERLGFRVRWLQQGFPDCEALRRVGAGKWQPVRIEFEYLSGNFVQHKHDAKGCDLIVCWRHNWQDCPVEVIELEKIIQPQISAD